MTAHDRKGAGDVRLTIDTETDTYDQALTAIQAAYGIRRITADWPEASDPRSGPQDLADDDLAEG
ncbi:hypothetical protein [Streptomyces sp. AS58]|uniref:hypothetical protein n=1 Tax=Streptomyces sp. AS58 TaxID=1519489 RepID=UPI001F34985C|nr:hypothetical protein [Streptomyces sp. AS58]